MVTSNRDVGVSAEESAKYADSRQVPSLSPVSTRVGRNSVEIDVPALKHLVDTLKNKLSIEEKI